MKIKPESEITVMSVVSVCLFVFSMLDIFSVVCARTGNSGVNFCRGPTPLADILAAGLTQLGKGYYTKGV